MVKRQHLVENDVQRRNTISVLLQDWNLLSIVKPEAAEKQSTFITNQNYCFQRKERMEFASKI